MKSILSQLFIVIAVSLFSVLYAVPQYHGIVKIYSFSSSDTFLIDWKWITSLNIERISQWCKTYACKVNPDDNPVVDSVAWFVSKYGSQIVFDNLESYTYYLFINFVTYEEPQQTNIDALCDIYCNHRFVKRLSFKDLTKQNSIVCIEIPREFIINKTLVVEFKEHSSAGGFFGVWDIILSTQDTLPSQFNVYKEDAPTVEKSKKMVDQKMKLVQPRLPKK